MAVRKKTRTTAAAAAAPSPVRRRRRWWLSPWLVGPLILLAVSVAVRFHGSNGHHHRRLAVNGAAGEEKKDADAALFLDDDRRKCEALLDRFHDAFAERRETRMRKLREFLEKKLAGALASKTDREVRDRVTKILAGSSSSSSSPPETATPPSSTASSSPGRRVVRNFGTIANSTTTTVTSIKNGGIKQKKKKKNEVKLWWIWDVEASCHTDVRGFLEERFPSETQKMYDTFYEGPKFLCGIDLMTSRIDNRRRRKLAGLPDRRIDNEQQQQQQQQQEHPCLVYKVGTRVTSINNKYQPLDDTVDVFLGCETHVFDRRRTDPRSRTNTDGLWTSHRDRGFDGDGDGDGPSSLIPDAHRELGHTGRPIDVLYLDCTGCEWDVLPPVLDAVTAGTITVHQIHTAMHDDRFDGDPAGSNPHVLGFFRKMDAAGMRILEKEPDFGLRRYDYVWVHEDFLRAANRDSLCGAS